MKVPRPDPQTAIPVAKARFFSKYIDTLTIAGKQISPKPNPEKQNSCINRRWEKQKSSSYISRRRPIQLYTANHNQAMEVMQGDWEGYRWPQENSCVAAESAVDIGAGEMRWRKERFIYFHTFCRGNRFNQINIYQRVSLHIFCGGRTLSILEYQYRLECVTREQQTYLIGT